MTKAPQPIPVALSVAGSDSGGGAGIQADLLTFAAMGVFGTTAITSLTAQNPDGVSAVHPVPPEFVTEQLEQVASFFSPAATKTGMLHCAEVIAAVAGFFARGRRIALVVDPVMVATSGAALLKPGAVEVLRKELFPLATLVTPNLDEAAVLMGGRPQSAAEMESAAIRLAGMTGVPVLLKGGHLAGGEVIDVLAWPDGRRTVHRDARIEGVDTHGSGCTLSAAVAAGLALGRTLEDAVAEARAYLRRAMSHPLQAGGRAFIGHFPGAGA